MFVSLLIHTMPWWTLLHSFSIRASNSTFFCCTVSNSSLKSLHMVIRDWFCSFRWHMTSLKFLLSVLWRLARRCECGSIIERSEFFVTNESGGEADSRGVGLRYTSNALDLCDDWNDGIDDFAGNCRPSSFSNDCGWFRDAYGIQTERKSNNFSNLNWACRFISRNLHQIREIVWNQQTVNFQFPVERRDWLVRSCAVTFSVEPLI